MSWLNKLLPPKIKRKDTRAERKTNLPEGLWSKCPSCEAVLYATDLEKNANVCPKCAYHNRIDARARIDLLLDAEGRFEIGAEVLPVDPLKFKDSRRYTERVKDATESTGETDSLVVMQGALKAMPVVVAVFEFGFMGGSMGSVLGELAGLAQHFVVVGTHALYAYESAAGVRIVPGALATRHSAADGRPLAYVCRGMACEAPVHSLDALGAALVHPG